MSEPLRTWALRVKPGKASKPKQKSIRPVTSISVKRQAIARHDAGDSYAAIAADLKIPVQSVKNWYARRDMLS